MLKTYTCALGVIIMLTGCFDADNSQQTEVSEADQLTGATWHVEDIDGRGVVDRSNTHINFNKDGTISGSTGCNNFRATYEADNSTITIGPAASTKKLCAPALNDQEQKFIAIFSNVNSFSFTDTGALMLKTEDNRTLTARKSDG